MTYVAIALLLGLIPAAIANRQNHSFAQWWLVGAVIFIIALPLSFFAKPMPEKPLGNAEKAGRAILATLTALAAVVAVAHVATVLQSLITPASG